MKTAKTWMCVAVTIISITISACGKGIGYDKGGDELGALMTAHLKAQPAVFNTTYRYSFGLDKSPSLWFTATVREPQVSDAVMRGLYELALDDYWRSPAEVYGIDIRFYSSGNPPLPNQNNSARVVKEYNFYWAESSAVKSDDQVRLEQQFGPRPTPPPTPTK